MKVLVIRFSSMGDIVLTSPLLRCMKQQLPDATLHFLTKPEYAGLLQANPYLDKVLLLETEIEEAAEQLQAEQYDLVVDLHDNLRSRQLCGQLNVKTLRYNKQRFRRFLLTTFQTGSVDHIVDRYFGALKPLGVIYDGKGLDFFIAEADEVPVQQLPFTHLAGYGVLVIGARHFTKRIPMDKLEAICRGITIPLVLIGGPEDAYAGLQLANTDPFKIWNACGNFTMGQSASVIKKAKFVITPDTGMMHIAAALNKRVISVWGGTEKRLGFTPFLAQANNSVIIEHPDLKCRPCHKHGRDRCPKGHFKCMNELDSGKILGVI